MHSADMILFNVANYREIRVFPYAFVQVSEVARRFNINVESYDVTDYPKEKLPFLVKQLINKYITFNS